MFLISGGKGASHLISSLSGYRASWLEQRIESFYRAHGVRYPIDVTLHLWDEALHIEVIRRPGPTNAVRMTDETLIIFNDSHKPLPIRRAEIAHEIGHGLLHSGYQTKMPQDWRSKQERQSDCFELYALAPTYLIADQIEEDSQESRQALVTRLSDTFCVPDPFMDIRLCLLQADLSGRPFDKTNGLRTKGRKI